jgi:hypothetical protein
MKLKLKINLKDMDQEIQKLEKELLKRTKDLSSVSKDSAIKKFHSKADVSYIG